MDEDAFSLKHAMFGRGVEALLRAACETTVARVAADRGRASPRLRPLLAYIEEHLFDPEFEVQEMARACGVHDHSIGSLFKMQLGDSPRDYVQDCRLVVAAKLLRGSRLAVSIIAELVGYSELKSFGRAFARWCEMSPSAFRKSVRKATALPPEAEWYAAPFLRRVVRGELDPEEEALSLLRGDAERALEIRKRVWFPGELNGK